MIYAFILLSATMIYAFILGYLIGWLVIYLQTTKK